MSLENKRPIHHKPIYNVVYNKFRVIALKTCWIHLKYKQACDLHALIKTIYNKHNAYTLWILRNILLIIFTCFQASHQKNIRCDTRCRDVVTH